MTSTWNNRSRRSSMGRLISLIAPVAMTLAWNHSSAADEIHRFLLEPTDDFPDTNGRFKYEMPAGYKVHQSCGTLPIGMGETADGGTSFQARPMPVGGEFSGFTLRVWNTRQSAPTPKTADSSCETIQILVLAPGIHQVEHLPGNWQLPPAKPRGTEDPGKAKSIFDDDFDALPPHRLTVHDLDPQLPEKAWVFATSTAPTELTVKLPTINGQQQTRCENGQPFDTVTFRTEKSLKLQLSPDGKDCSSPKEQIVVLLVNDALALPEIERKKIAADIKQSGRIEPVRDDALRIWIPGLLAQRSDLRLERSFVLPIDKRNALPQWGSCRAGQCPLMIYGLPWDATDTEFELKLSTPASRRLERGLVVYDPTGKPMEKAAATLETISKWTWPQNRIPVPVQDIGPDKRTAITVTSLAVHMVPPGKVLSCRYLDKDGKEQKVDGCAVLRKEAGKEHALYLEAPQAQKVLSVSDATLFVDLPESIQWLEGSATDKTPVSLELSTVACDFSFTQLTETIAGTRRSEVLYFVESIKNPERCLRVPLNVRTAGADAAGPVKIGLTTWIQEENDYDPTFGRVLKVRLAEVQDGTVATTYPLVATFGRDPTAQTVPLHGGLDNFDLQVSRGIDDREVTLDIEVGGEASSAVLANQPHLAVRRTNRLYLASPMDRPWRVRLASLSNHARVPPSGGFGVGSIVVSSDPRVLSSASANGRTAYFLDGTVPTETDLLLRAELDGLTAQFLRSEGKRIAGKGRLSKVLNAPLTLGYVEKPLRDKKTRGFRLPWDLRQAELHCGHQRVGIRSSSPTRGLKPDEYRGCKIHVSDSEQPFRRQIEVDGDTELNWGAQQLVVVAMKNGGPQEVQIARLDREDFTHIAHRFVARLDEDVLRKLGDATSYADVQIVVRHVQPSDSTLSAELKDAYIPVDLDQARSSELRARTRLLPWGGRVWPLESDGLSWGHRLYVSGSANLSLYQSSDPGVGSTKSSAYEGAVKANFGYGVLGTIEPWNFSDNKPWLPIFSPQVNIGLFGPTDLDQPRAWRQFAFVYGLTLRLPAASTPRPETTEAQTGLIAWGRLTIGDRGELMHSLLLGVNVAIGAAP